MTLLNHLSTLAEQYQALILAGICAITFAVVVGEYAAWRARSAMSEALRGYAVVKTVIPPRDPKTKRFVRVAKRAEWPT